MPDNDLLSATADDPGGRDARTALLEAAAAELAEHGSAGMRLRAVARRAGLSHAAPQHFFGSRAGLLTALATKGFDALTEQLAAVQVESDRDALAALGRVYIDFGLSHPSLFDLMFRPGELVADDPELQRSQTAAIGMLASSTTGLAPAVALPSDVLTIISWAFVHGVVVLSRTGALQGPGEASQDPAVLVRNLVDSFGALVTGR